jgi:hypothetical protein
MKRLIISIFLLVSLIANSATYYVATTGNDGASGDITHPWVTWQKAFITAVAGDTVYFRGGVWEPTTQWYGGNNICYIKPTSGIGHSGTPGNPICYFNYPGETPILDCKYIHTAGNYNTCLLIQDADFLNFRGLTIRNVYQRTSNVSVVGINVYYGSNFNFENISIHDLGGRAWALMSYNLSFAYDTVRWINCDVYNLADSLAEESGNLADGWKVVTNLKRQYYYWDGCRAWNTSDDGFDVGGLGGMVILNNCWAFNIGHLSHGDGNGFKISTIDSVSYPTKILIHCLAAFCHGYTNSANAIEEIDYQVSDTSYHRTNARIYNCTFYKNDMGPGANTNALWHFRNSVYRNNISYMNRVINTAVPPGVRMNVVIYDYPYPESHNTWDALDPRPASWPPWFVETDSVTVNEASFVLTDSVAGITQLMSSRKVDYSLPDVTFLHLASGSNMIDAGIQVPPWDNANVTLSYNGVHPDLGYAEYVGGAVIYVTSITVSGAGGATTISTDNGTLQLSASILPIDATYQTVSWSITNGSGSASISGGGLVTAVTDGTVTARATAVDGSDVYGELEITISNQTSPPSTGVRLLKYNGKLLKSGGKILIIQN